uniref:Uncharacterized protein n=1 Tax=Anguilla anguilla TaxID=7936 RepID=A0A0E9TGW6_ANGAN
MNLTIISGWRGYQVKALLVMPLC